MGRRTPRQERSKDRVEIHVLAPVAYLLAGLLCVVVFVAALPRPAAEPTEVEEGDDPVAALQARIANESRFPARWRETLDALCADPVLRDEGIAADCRTGTITFGDELFDEDGTVQLTAEGIRKLHHAISVLLEKLRAHDEVWARIEAIELRGHADPRALRDPYVTNMRISQRRPMAMMFHLISDWGLTDADRRDLERLMVLSAASHSRPPAICPERTHECYARWRRVEITPRLSGADLADDLGRLAESVDALTDTGGS